MKIEKTTVTMARANMAPTCLAMDMVAEAILYEDGGTDFIIEWVLGEMNKASPRPIKARIITILIIEASRMMKNKKTRPVVLNNMPAVDMYRESTRSDRRPAMGEKIDSTSGNTPRIRPAF